MKKQSLLSYIFSNKAIVWGVLCLVLLAGIMAEATPFLQSLLVNSGIVSKNESAFWCICVAILVVLFLDLFARVFLMFLTNKAGFNIAKKIRNDFFIKLINQPYSFFKENRSGDMVFRTNIFIFTTGDFLSKNLQDLCIGLARFVVIFAYMFVLNIKLALALTLLYIVALIVAILHTYKTYKIGKKYKSLELHRNSLLLQNLDNLETYLAYNDNFEYLEEYNKVNLVYRKTRGQFFFAKHMFYPLIDFFVSMGTVLIYQLTFTSTFGIIEVGVIVAMLSYANRISSPIQLVAEGLAECVGANATISQIFNFENKLIKNKKNNYFSQKINISCKNIGYFDKNNNTKFEHINLEIPFGSCIAISGSYGQGKSNFGEILMGLTQPKTGKVLFNNIDISTIKQQDVLKHISVASDDVGIFEATIFENVHLANPSSTKDEVLNAITKSGLLAKTKNLPNGIHTKITPQTISEGDKQLIAFARVILKNTPIVIFDEFTRDLEQEEKLKFFKNLKNFSKNKTIIFISQKAPQELNFDRKILFSKYHK